MGEEVVESGLETRDLFPLLLADGAAVCDFLQTHSPKISIRRRKRDVKRETGEDREDREEKEKRVKETNQGNIVDKAFVIVLL